MVPRLAALLIATAVLAGCTGSGGDSGTGSDAATPSATATTTVVHSSPSGPIAAGPTTAVAAERCPYVGQDYVRDTIGMRLGRITVLRSADRPVGCRFYALQGSSLHSSEHLPGPNQPAVEITTRRFASSTAAHNAFVRTARAGANPQQVDLGGGTVGVCFQTAFYAKDHGTDWACATSRGSTSLLVRTVVTSPALNAKLVTQRVLRGL